MDKKRARKLATFVIRWGIAALGIWYVLSRMAWNDHVLAVLPSWNAPADVTLAERDAHDEDRDFRVVDPRTHQVVLLNQDVVWNEPDRANLHLFTGGKVEYVVGVDLAPDMKHARRLLLANAPDGRDAHAVPAQSVPGYTVTVPHPRVEIGVLRMVRQANVGYLLAALAVFPITIFITSFRWNELLKALDISLSFSRTFVLNMVGLFYNTFMPGSTGGDVLKAYYVAKQTHHRTRAVMSVIVDRAIGLLALIILGGTMASLQSNLHICYQVAKYSAMILLAVIFGIVLFYVPLLRKLSGLDFVIDRLPMQKQVRKAIETMHIYGRRPFLALASLIASFPVHIVVIIAAELCGIAFGLKVRSLYYWMAVPVIILAGSIPISPQGAGVMEFFAIKLFEPQGVTVAQAFALTMSIRLTQIFWNLIGGFFVLRGGYHAPTQSEQKEVEGEDVDEEGESPK